MLGWPFDLLLGGKLQEAFFFFISLFLARSVLEKSLKHADAHWPREWRLKQLERLRHLSFFLLVFGIGAIWSEELRSMMVSLIAVALAIVIGLKELILCLHGYILLLRHRAYRLGDQITIAHLHGEVIDIGLFSTTLLEDTNDQMVTTFPNSLLVTHGVVNHTHCSDWVELTQTVWLTKLRSLTPLREKIVQAATEVLLPYFEEANRSYQRRSRSLGYQLRSVHPHVHWSMTDEGIALTVTVIVPKQHKAQLATILFERYVALLLEE